MAKLPCAYSLIPEVSVLPCLEGIHVGYSGSVGEAEREEL